MHFLTLRQRSSKVYSNTVYSIPMDNDRSHINMNSNKVEETKVVHEKRQIDKIMQGIIKQRLFSNFIEEESRLSDENYTKIMGICKKGFFRGRLRDKGKPVHHISKTIEANPSIEVRNTKREVTFNTTIQCFPTAKEGYSIDTIPKEPRRFFQSESRQRRESMRLPDLQRADTSRSIKIRTTQTMIYHPKKLEFNEKPFHETFRKWAGGNNQSLIHELRVSKDAVIARFKNILDGVILEKFFHFFGFPQQFGLRQYANLMENAVNSSLRFIYFWMFIILDDNTNGVLTSQELFQFLQKFPDNNYIEEQLFLLGNYITRLEKQGKQEGREIQIPVEESLTVNRNLKMEQLKDILKQSTKERIEVNCVKNTCYHQTILSLEHDTLERAKLNQIENNEEMTKLMKLKRKDEKKKLENLIGLRLRDFPIIFSGKRPKIFCFVLHLLSGLRPSDYE